MVRKESSEGKKGKPRGRPFTKGSKRGKPKDDVLDATGLESSDEGRAVTPTPQSSIVEQSKHEIKPIPQQLEVDKGETDITLKEIMDSPQVEPEKPGKNDDLELIEAIEFRNGDNVLSMRFSKRHNRMFRIQIFLNDSIEIRPVTYTGATTGYAFWNMLKGALKK